MLFVFKFEDTGGVGVTEGLTVMELDVFLNTILSGDFEDEITVVSVLLLSCLCFNLSPPSPSDKNLYLID